MARRRRGGIKIKKSRAGSLRRHTKTPKGKNIPVSKLRAAKRSRSPAIRKKANFALNARKWKKTGRRKRR